MKVLADGLFFSIAEDSFCSRVPERDQPLFIHHQDCILGGIGNCLEFLLCFFETYCILPSGLLPVDSCYKLFTLKRRKLQGEIV